MTAAVTHGAEQGIAGLTILVTRLRGRVEGRRRDATLVQPHVVV